MLILFFIFVKKLIIMRLACMDFFIWGYIICSEVSCRHKLRLAHLFPLSENIIVSNELNMDIILSYKHEWLFFWQRSVCAWLYDHLATVVLHWLPLRQRCERIPAQIFFQNIIILFNIHRNMISESMKLQKLIPCRMFNIQKYPCLNFSCIKYTKIPIFVHWVHKNTNFRASGTPNYKIWKTRSLL
jgi:hypothetical protein